MAFKYPAYMIEYAAAELWKHDNPAMSVFDCNAEMQELYRERVRIVIRSLAMEVK